jgi:hypothetical protein
MIFYPECGGDIFPRNIGLYMTTRRYIPEDDSIFIYGVRTSENKDTLLRTEFESGRICGPSAVLVAAFQPYSEVRWSCAPIPKGMESGKPHAELPVLVYNKRI